jgi:hypothetical protein
LRKAGVQGKWKLEIGKWEIGNDVVMVGKTGWK